LLKLLIGLVVASTVSQAQRLDGDLVESLPLEFQYVNAFWEGFQVED